MVKNRSLQSDTIVILNQSSGYLQIDLLEVFNSKYAKRAIIAGEIRFRKKLLDSDIKWHKVVKYNRKSKFTRIATWLVCTFQMLYILITKYRHADLLIVSNPPTSILLPLIIKNSFSLLVYDVYPDSLYQSGLINRKSLIVKYWGKINRKIFRKANRIFTLTDGMKEALSAYVNFDKIEVIPIWTDNKFLRPLEKKQNPFIKKHNISEKFVILYSGNLGHTHDIETIVELASTINNPEIIFVIIGEGEKEVLLAKMIQEYNLQNVLMLPWQPTDQLPYTLSSADLAIVTLGKDASTLSVPSKTFNYLSVGAPVLCIGSKKSELHRLINQYGIGKCFQKNEISEMRDFIYHLKSDQDYHLQLRQNSLIASRDFGPENALMFLDEALVVDVIN